jgi:riboflavin kinase/FMN adenylyltransferase
MLKMETNQWYIGKVIRGNNNGRKFGFPTVNIELTNNNFALSTGVYAAEVRINDEHFRGMLYVGKRRTLNLNDLSIEINIFDFDRDIYDKEISFLPLKKFFDEQKFNSVEELIEHIKYYKKTILTYFNE